MATQSNRKPNSNSRARSNSGNSRSRTTNASRNSKQVQVPERSTYIDYWHYFRKTRFFKPVMIVVCITLLVLINLLLSWNNYTRFFVISGIELIVVALFSIFKLGLKITIDAAEEDNSGT